MRSRLAWLATPFGAILALAAVGPVAAQAAPAAVGATGTTAWNGSQFVTDAPGLVSESDIVLGGAPKQASQSMPLGNGTLGAAVWDANGLTAQLNRADTMPDRLSPGQVVIPGLAALTGASDYSGRLGLYNATLAQSGGGMTAQTYVRADKDELVVSVTGADPTKVQTAQIKLWSPRTPTAYAGNGVAALAQTWQDAGTVGASGSTFGSLAALTADGVGVTASKVDALTAQVSFKPHPDGSFQVLVVSPSYAGSTDPLATATAALGSDATASASALSAAHQAWWANYWNTVGLIKLTSTDQQAQYIENIRTIAQYSIASEERGNIPGSQAGVADLFNYGQDYHQWDPTDFWHWNLRAQTALNLGDGAFALDAPYFNLYGGNLANLQSWTQTHMGSQYSGICVPETMGYDGQGYEDETWASAPQLNCDSSVTPTWNARTITTGAEVALNVWQYYQYTGDTAFLTKYYPLMQQAAAFLLSYAKVGADGKLHTYPSNAHEEQWDVHDPTTDIAAEQALFPAVIKAAQQLNTDASLVSSLQAALPQLLAYNTTGTGTSQVIAPSYDPSAALHNSENTGLEPVWPYGQIGDDGPLTTLARQTFAKRPNVRTNDWSFDAVDAARLGLPADVKTSLIGLTQAYQAYPSGLANFASGNEPYLEQSATVGLAVQESLVQDYDGELRIAPALPSGWDAAGTVYIPGNSKVSVQVQGGVATTVVVHAGSNTTMKVRNPWPGQNAEVLDSSGATVVASTNATDFMLPVKTGTDYLIEPVAAPIGGQTFAAVSGTPATAYKTLGSVSIGLPAPPPPAAPSASLSAAYDNVSITDDAATSAGNIDGGGASFSAQALAAVGAGPGAKITHAGQSFTWPAGTPGTPDNVICAGQTFLLSGSGTTLGFLLTGSYGPISGAGTITYTDGSTQSYTIGAPDWGLAPPAGSDVALQPAYQNRQNNTRYAHPGYVFYAGVTIDPSKTIKSVTLPAISSATAAPVPTLHVYAVSVGGADTTPPTVSATVSPSAPNGTNGWYTGPVTVTASAADPGDPNPTLQAQVDGGAWAQVSAPIVVSAEGSHTVAVRATDAAGNTSAVTTSTFKIDTTPPVSSATVDVTARTVTLRAADTTSGLDHLDYQLPGGTWTTYTAPITVGPAATTVAFRAVDKAGNTEPANSVTVPRAGTPLQTSITKVTPATAAVAAGKSVALKITVVGGGATPTGTVDVADGATLLGTATLINGKATFSATGSALGVGQHTVTLTYNGNTTYDVSHTTTAITVTAASSAAAVTVSPATAAYGTAVKATVKITAPGVVPTGTVTLLEGTTTIATAQLDATGKAAFTLTDLTVGAHSLHATYSGDGLVSASTSPSSTATITLAPTTITATVPKVRANAGIPVTARVTAKPATAQPSGDLTIAVTSSIATTVQSTTATLTSGAAAAVLTGLPAGTYTVQISYPGDRHTAPSTITKTLTVT